MPTNWDKLFMPLVEGEVSGIVTGFWRKRGMPQHPINSWERDLVNHTADELLAHLRESGVVERMRNEVLEEAAKIAGFHLRASGHLSVNHAAEPVEQAIRAAKAKLLGKGEK